MHSLAFRAAIVVATLGSAAGCVRVVREPTLPALQGRVVLGDTPVAGARILVTKQRGTAACQDMRLAASTAADGSFEFEGERAFVLVPVAGDPTPTWEVCVEYDGVVHPGYRPFGFGLQDKVQLACDIGKTPTHPFEGICE